jgi:hypothetical protein
MLHSWQNCSLAKSTIDLCVLMYSWDAQAHDFRQFGAITLDILSKHLGVLF